MDKKQLLLTLKYVKGIGNVTAKAIMDSIKDDLTLKELYLEINKNPKIRLSNFSVLEEAQEKAVSMLDKIKNSDIHMVTQYDKEYPDKLLLLKDSPIFIFYAGDINILTKPCVTIIGSRTSSVKGLKVAYNLSTKLCKHNVIISGLAEGIDTEAHKATIDNNGKTVAILAHGLDTIFPIQNKRLANEIIEKGGLLISEYPIGQTYSKYTFVARDRLQSVLADKVFVIETKDDGGTMHAANKALEHNIELYVFKSKDKGYLLPSGNIKLIKDGAKPFNEDFYK